ncbi:hypothetical protein N7526_008214 [Penicillium atrosanguineum]|nr:hypothetical protein N7526_008214 [Penicillium atrosanguineum]
MSLIKAKGVLQIEREVVKGHKGGRGIMGQATEGQAGSWGFFEAGQSNRKEGREGDRLTVGDRKPREQG